MIYTDQQLIEKIRKMIIDFEDEVVEFKETRTNYSFKDIGKYFSALGNEANIRGFKEAWLIFGVINKKEIVGAAYAREDENISPLPMDKVDLIRSQVGVDWSKEIVEGATFEDLDPEAVSYAKLYVAESTFSYYNTHM